MEQDARKQLAGQVLADAGGAFVTGLAYIGDRLGLFKALAASGPVSSASLADQVQLNERYVREWLKAMVSAGYAEYNPESGTFAMTADQAAVLADDASPVFAAGAFQFAIASLALTGRLIECFREGGGIAYGELDPEIPDAIDRMHRAWFEHQLVASWLAGAGDLVARLTSGIRVLDVGCGVGRAGIAIGTAFPNSTVVGVDPHGPSVAEARELAAGLSNVTFRESAVESVPEDQQFDLVLAIDCIHDMQDPVGTLVHIGRLLAPGGVLFWSEPAGSDNPVENRNPPGRMRSALSPYHCLTVSLAAGGPGLGTIIGEAGARSLALEAGLGEFRTLDIPSAMQQFFVVYK